MKNSGWLLWRDPGRASMRINPLGFSLILLALTFSVGGFAVEYNSPELVQAVSARDHDRVRQLVSDGLQFSERPAPRQRTPLFIAAQNNDFDMLEVLLKAGADINERTRSGASLLMVSAYAGSPERVAFLLRHGAEPHLRDRRHGATALMDASILGKVENARLLLDAGVDPNVQTKAGRSALSIAISEGHEDLVRLLLEHGADPNLSSGLNSSLIAGAVREQNKTFVSQLLAAGADVNGAGRGRSPLYWAIETRDADLALLLLNAGADPNRDAAIVQAARRGMTQVVDKMIETGCDVNQPGPGRLTALHMAAATGDLKMVVTLVRAGSNPRAKDASGLIPFDMARPRGVGAVAEYLKAQTQ